MGDASCDSFSGSFLCKTSSVGFVTTSATKSKLQLQSSQHMSSLFIRIQMHAYPSQVGHLWSVSGSNFSNIHSRLKTLILFLVAYSLISNDLSNVSFFILTLTTRDFAFTTHVQHTLFPPKSEA